MGLNISEDLPGKLLQSTRAKRVIWIAALVISSALLLLPEAFRLDGTRHANWMQFAGRFHPLAVHIPIGLIVLVPLLEIAGAFRPALREAASFVLGLSCIACLGTLMLGYLLAYGSGASGITVTRHLWGGIVLAIGLFLSVVARSSWSSGLVGQAYPVLLACVLVTLLWTADQGGALTHGRNYLTEYMPAKLKRLIPLGAVSAGRDSDSFYGKQIQTILDANCVACHGAGKTEGDFRMDSYALLMKGGKDGPVVLPHNAQGSILLERITLPADNKHFMPAEGRPPLKSEEIARIHAWIEQGASLEAGSAAGIATEQRVSDLPPQPVGDYTALMPEIQRMAQSQGANLMPVSAQASDGLILNTVDAASNFGDAQLAQFEKYAPYIVEANLARTALTDASFESLSKFTHLRALHLEGTAILGHGLANLAPLSQLTYLNLSETRVDRASLAALASMKNLRHLYLFDTPAQPSPGPESETNTRSAQ
jgi:mono/diheme cytochrome c family protein